MSSVAGCTAAHAALSEGARTARRLGLFGGSFDPPHAAHVHVARAAREAFALDHVLFVPAARPPHKPGRRLASGEARCRMLELLLEGEPASSLWTVELSRAGPSYTLDTVRSLQSEAVSEQEAFLILGADNLEGLPGWYGAEELLERVRPVVCVRPGSELSPASLARLDPAVRARVEEGVLRVEPREESSSAIRAALAGGAREVDGVPRRLLEYLLERDIYGECECE